MRKRSTVLLILALQLTGCCQVSPNRIESFYRDLKDFVLDHKEIFFPNIPITEAPDSLYKHMQKVVLGDSVVKRILNSDNIIEFGAGVAGWPSGKWSSDPRHKSAHLFEKSDESFDEHRRRCSSYKSLYHVIYLDNIETHKVYTKINITEFVIDGEVIVLANLEMTANDPIGELFDVTYVVDGELQKIQ